MKLIERSAGGVAVAFGLLGMAATSMARGMQTSTPALEGAAWTGPVRAVADWMIYIGFIAAGSSLIVRRYALLAWGLVALLAGGRWLFDLVAADASTSRGLTILSGDRIAVFAAVLGTCIALVSRRGRPRNTVTGTPPPRN